jgi:dTDP-4-dehydrorhamnose 3,5-epimerase-like enzyme
MKKKLKLIDADISIDERGELIFCNDFDMKKIKRFYHISNFSTPFVRAWHGHKIENKYIMVTKGSAFVAAVQVDDWKKPSKSLNITTFLLNDKKPKLLFIPGGYAHGYKTLLPDTRLVIFSTATLKESLKDDYRYEAYYWNPWKIKER